MKPVRKSAIELEREELYNLSSLGNTALDHHIHSLFCCGHLGAITVRAGALHNLTLYLRTHRNCAELVRLYTGYGVRGAFVTSLVTHPTMARELLRRA